MCGRVLSLDRALFLFVIIIAMRRLPASRIFAALITVLALGLPAPVTFSGTQAQAPASEESLEGRTLTNRTLTGRTLIGIIQSGETLSTLFDSLGLSPGDMDGVLRASRSEFNLSRIKVGQPYRAEVDAEGRLLSFVYEPDINIILTVTRTDKGFKAKIEPIPYERMTFHAGGVIRDNLVSSLQGLALALELTDVFAWDIDFATGLRQGDTFRIVAEKLYRDGEFVRYGRILAAEFVNDGQTYHAYRFASADGRISYFNEKGQSMRRTFLKAPLVYRRISSGYTYGRYHPILKKVMPHLGIDYAAASGTPVSTVGDGKVVFAGWKGPNGNLVVIKHAGSFTTSYGHLKKIARGIRKGAKVSQGQVVGWVGATGRATGPHLDYRVKQGGRAVNPLKIVSPRDESLSKDDMRAFAAMRESMSERLSSIETGAGLMARALRSR